MSPVDAEIIAALKGGRVVVGLEVLPELPTIGSVEFFKRIDALREAGYIEVVDVAKFRLTPAGEALP